MNSQQHKNMHAFSRISACAKRLSMSWSELIRLFERSFVVRGWRVYPCSRKGYGACLIENEVDRIFYVIVGSDSEYKPLSLKRVERTRNSFSVYRGKKISVLIFVGKFFSEVAKKTAENGIIENTVLLELGQLNASPTSVNVYASSVLMRDFLVLKLTDFLRKALPSFNKGVVETEPFAIFESYGSVEVVKFSRKKPKTVSPRKMISSIRVLAFSDWRVQEINDVFQFIGGIEPVDLVLYAGDDIGRFEEEGLNFFSELSKYTKSNQVLAVAGNDDLYLQKRVLRGDRIQDLYDRSFVYHNFAFIGLESVTRGPALFRHIETDFEEHLKRQIKETRGRRIVILSHTPPNGILDRGIRFADMDENGTHHIGSTSLRRFIETENVDLVVCGHCHSQGGMAEHFEGTMVVNVSSHDSPGSKGNIAVIELAKDGTVDVDWHDTTEILGKNSLMQIHGIGPAYAERLGRSGVRDIAQLSKIRNLTKVACKSRISMSILKLLQLKARAFLENRVYQIAPFNLLHDKAIFFDIETDVACERVWLIGLQIDGKLIQLYADTWEQEKRILEEFIEILKGNPDYNLISYSTTNFDHRVILKAIERHELDATPLTSRCHSDLGILIRRCFVFPRKSYALKDLGALLGYKFKYPEMNGLFVAMSYHRHIEENKPLDPKILEYNQDDVRVVPHMIEKIRNSEFRTERINLSIDGKTKPTRRKFQR